MIVKTLKIGFRKVIDSGRKRGSGRGVGLLVKECNEMWAGSTAVEKLDGGLDTSSINEEKRDSSFCNHSDSPLAQGSGSPHLLRIQSTMAQSLSSLKMKARKEELLETLNEWAHAKCMKQAPVHDQLLTLAKEDSMMRKDDLELRKKYLELFEAAERNFSHSLQQMSQDMARTMTDELMTIATMLQQQQHQQHSASHHFMPGYQWRYQHDDEEGKSSSFTKL